MEFSGHNDLEQDQTIRTLNLAHRIFDPRSHDLTVGSRLVASLLTLFAQYSIGMAQDSLAAGRDPRGPVAVPLTDVRATGELAERLAASFNRLEDDWYRPPTLYDSPNDGWPGDKEGRTLLGLVYLSQVTGRTSKYLAESLDQYRERVNADGYLGPIIAPDAIPEQTLGGQFWMVRALHEYGAWKSDERMRNWANQIVRNVYLSAAGNFANYPITPSERKWQSAVYGTAVGQRGKWVLSSDIGCGLAGSLDALTDVYARQPSDETGRVLEEVIQRFLEMDLEAVSAAPFDFDFDAVAAAPFRDDGTAGTAAGRGRSLSPLPPACHDRHLREPQLVPASGVDGRLCGRRLVHRRRAAVAVYGRQLIFGGCSPHLLQRAVREPEEQRRIWL